MNFFSPQELDIFGRMVLAVILGALIGLEREVSRKHAGLRTYALVSLGAALFTMLAEKTYTYYWQTFGGAPNFDSSRIVSQIVVGIGFLGAGMVIFHKEKLMGLTTAAGIWVTAAIGAAVGVRAISMAISGTVLTLFILVVLRWCEERMKWRGNEINVEREVVDSREID
ncbi:MAG: MgtC/SapB family protein [Parcubacteria group bacterium]|nr:MgtC/SapB family protein [Parcubacteria group bacterium]